MHGGMDVSGYHTSTTASQPPDKTRCMSLWSFSAWASVSVCHPQRGRPLNGDVQMRNNIKLLAMITLVHIKNYLTEFDVPPEMEFHPMNPPIEGLASIWVHLGGLEESLQDSRCGQVYEDLSSMRGWVHSLSQALGCPDLAKPGGEALKTVYQSLVEGQRYMEKISLNLNKLKIC